MRGLIKVGSFEVSGPIKIDSDSTELTFTIYAIIEHYEKNVLTKIKNVSSGVRTTGHMITG